jgi:hypothetical protein
MQSETIHNTSTLYRSDVRPDIVTEEVTLAKVITWADDNPQVWQIVTDTKSKAFGLGSSVYIGWAQRSMAPEAILERTRHFHDLVLGIEPHLSPSHFFVWRAQFTYENFLKKGFTGGFFQQHDEKHPRLCVTLDYTPETLEEVIDRFLYWCGRDYPTHHVTVNKKTVRQGGGLSNG